MNSLLTSQENIRRLIRFLWGAVLLTLPVTSFRYFPGLGETTYVRPLAFYPLLLAFYLPFIVIPAALGTVAAMLLVRVLPLLRRGHWLTLGALLIAASKS